jgi:hypothetical protein
MESYDITQGFPVPEITVKLKSINLTKVLDPAPASYSELTQRVNEKFGVSKIEYFTIEGDKIRVEDDEDLRAAYKMAEKAA